MLESKYIAPYVLRLYVWEILKKNLGMDDSDYDIDGDGKGFIPIVPLGEEPELENFNKPYIVYGFAESPITNTRIAGNIMFTVYSTDFRDMAEVANTIFRAFEDDWAVDEVNAYSSTIPAFIGLRFGHVQGSTLEGGIPEDSPGGRMHTTLNIRYEYFSEYNVDNKLAVWNGSAQTYERL